jgi:hypothetical protein
LRDSKAGESAEQQSPLDETICGEEDLFRSNGSPSKTKIYGRSSQFLVYEQVGQGRCIGNRVRPWLTCGCSIRTTVAPNRDWFSAQKSCASWEYRDTLIEAAAKSDPQGFLLFDDPPDQVQQAGSHADQAPQPNNRQPESWR